MNESMMMLAVKPILPFAKKEIKKMEPSLIKYFESIPLQGDETHVAAFTEINEGTVYVVIGAFTDKTFTRFIYARPLVDFIISLLDSSIKK